MGVFTVLRICHNIICTFPQHLGEGQLHSFWFEVASKHTLPHTGYLPSELFVVHRKTNKKINKQAKTKNKTETRQEIPVLFPRSLDKARKTESEAGGVIGFRRF